jgi:hypothetical protein
MLTIKASAYDFTNMYYSIPKRNVLSSSCSIHVSIVRYDLSLIIISRNSSILKTQNFVEASVTNIRKYQIYSRCVGSGSRNKIIAHGFFSITKYTYDWGRVQIHTTRNSEPQGFTNLQALRNWECGCAIVYCANLTEANITKLQNPEVTVGCAVVYCPNLT